MGVPLGTGRLAGAARWAAGFQRTFSFAFDFVFSGFTL
jgi:hypothetical protein